MRLDHIAYRVKSRHKTRKFFEEAFGYKVQEEFCPLKGVACVAMQPPERCNQKFINYLSNCEYHVAPEIFISDGGPETIVGQWVAARGGVGGIHHLAYQVEDVRAKMDEWQRLGYAEFATAEPLTCPGITQVFTKPSELIGVIYEFISREEDRGFCQNNVADLMESTRDFQ